MKKLETLLIGCTDDFTDLEWILSPKFRNWQELATLSVVVQLPILSDYENLKEMTGWEMLQLNNCDLRGDIAKFMNELPAGLRLALHQCRFICQNTRL